MTVLPDTAAAGTGTPRPVVRPARVVFDYGEVFSRHVDVRPALARMLGVPVPDFCDAWAAERHLYDRGVTDLAYWRAVGARLGVRIAPELAAELTAVDLSGWSRVRPEAIALLEELAANGTPLALLSNAPRSHARFFRRRPWAAHFQHLWFSGETGRAKPDPEAWEPLPAALNARPSQLLFFDDRQENVDSARTAGLRAELWTGTAPARRVLAELGLLPAPSAAAAPNRPRP